MPKTHEKTSRKPVLPLLFAPPSRKEPHRVRNSCRLPNPIRYNRRNLSQPNRENCTGRHLFPQIAANPTVRCNSESHRSPARCAAQKPSSTCPCLIPLSHSLLRGCSLENPDTCTLFVKAFLSMYRLHYTRGSVFCKEVL